MKKHYWHYRSRHEALITFSNINFYRNQLNTFPSPYYDGKEFGISYTYIDGYYDRTRTKTVIDNGKKEKITSGQQQTKMKQGQLQRPHMNITNILTTKV